MPEDYGRIVATTGTIDVPERITDETPMILVLHLSDPHRFSFDVSAQITFATVGRDVTCTVARDGNGRISLTYRIGPRKSWWMAGGLHDRQLVSALHSVLGLAAALHT